MTDAKTLAERLRWLSHNSGWGDDATAKAAAELIERQNAELAALRADYENACKLVADMHAAAMGENFGPAIGVVEDIAALRAERDALQQALPQFQHLRKPLTKVQITELAEKCGYDGAVPTVRLAYQGFRLDAFARAIEAEHGITGETE